MDDHERLSGEFSAVLRPLLEKAHSLGYQIGSFRLQKHSEPIANIAPRDFSGCTIECGPDADGHMVCKVHCP